MANCLGTLQSSLIIMFNSFFSFFYYSYIYTLSTSNYTLCNYIVFYCILLDDF